MPTSLGRPQARPVSDKDRGFLNKSLEVLQLFKILLSNVIIENTLLQNDTVL